MHATCFEQPSVSAHKIELQLKDNLAPHSHFKVCGGDCTIENDNSPFYSKAKRLPTMM